MSQRIVINECYGGFGLSDQALKLLGLDWLAVHELPRDNPGLVTAVELLGDAANGAHAKLKIVEIPDGVEWQIEEYDGNEWVAEKHRRWS